MLDRGVDEELVDQKGLTWALADLRGVNERSNQLRRQGVKLV
jgi:hypothetical protein